MNVQTEISDERVSDLLCSALEYGSQYWYLIKKYNKPENFNFRSDKSRIYRHLDYPLNEGGSLVITADDGAEINGQTEFILNRESIQRGLDLLAKEHPEHFADVINENDDASTGDVFLQLCLFGEIVFG